MIPMKLRDSATAADPPLAKRVFLPISEATLWEADCRQPRSRAWDLNSVKKLCSHNAECVAILYHAFSFDAVTPESAARQRYDGWVCTVCAVAIRILVWCLFCWALACGEAELVIKSCAVVVVLSAGTLECWDQLTAILEVMAMQSNSPAVIPVSTPNFSFPSTHVCWYGF